MGKVASLKHHIKCPLYTLMTGSFVVEKKKQQLKNKPNYLLLHCNKILRKMKDIVKRSHIFCVFNFLL